MNARPPSDAALLTIVTISWNAAESIERTIESVQAQTYPNVEHLFIDGGSTDGTLDLIRERMRPQDRLIAEPDRGISDALNKGVAQARGDFIQFLHADDAIPPEFAVKAVSLLQSPDQPAFVYGDLIMEQAGAPAFHYAGEPNYRSIIPRRMPNINHPTCVHRRRAFDTVGPFDEDLKCAMDYDWFLRAAKLGVFGMHSPELVAHMNIDGVSNTRFRRTITEVRQIAARHGRPAPIAWSEWAFRTAKTSVGQVVRGMGGGAYYRLRSIINPTVKP